MLSLRFGLGSRKYERVKVMIFWRGKASYLYSTAITIRESQRKPREGSDHLKDDSEVFGKFQYTKEPLGRVSKSY